jgi:DNA-directed RNA polymerase specialized sigma24 family protein
MSPLQRRTVVGDERAFERLVARYGWLLCGIAGEFPLTREQATDAAQNTWTRLAQELRNDREPARLAGWLSSTMRRECIRLVNRRRVEEDEPSWKGPSTRPTRTRRWSVDRGR